MKVSELRFQQIYNEFHDRIFRYLIRMAGENEAEDLTQEVFIKISRALPDFRGEARLSTWIYKIATNTALDKLRHPSTHQQKTKRISIDAVEEIEEDRNAWTGEQTKDSEQRIIRQEMNGCIREVIDRLPESYRTIIVLSELEGMKDSEIAEILGLSLQTAKIRLHRGRTRLKDELKKVCVFYRDDDNTFACDRKDQSHHPKLIQIK